MTTMKRGDLTLVSVANAGLIPWAVLRWLESAERLGVRFRVVGRRVEYEPGEFACIGGLPPPAERFLTKHADEVRRVVLATPAARM